MKIALASDHAGFEAKEKLKLFLNGLGYDTTDFGVSSTDSVDYPDYALPVAQAVSNGKFERGILLCGSGIGMAIVANKVPGVRAAPCHNPFIARTSRSHNDANVLCLSGWTHTQAEIEEMTQVWLETRFSGGRHIRRLKKIEEIEKLVKVRKS
ncbi:ribose 5-phosphate isomerase B [candidate division NPL-UPA2 bacterium Unc8]|uniref:Ribose 5-phosphate isomerase B n=1 Tax=candidate division NPL-UPA2 bacterium Unc8 TaxID=1980939 RepID=A0A399FY44_UNCN2|nr:putative sugar phosphate isomerase YwlF [Bacillota bacterium]MBT9146947.1 putative sugar phosphate isomerase YwlF [Bacillota bacterium]RII01141.1 MAG: ribose 5-phosphate isomerase B [candidate division NPL-UPA2 bacterium Unc8]